jgi:hypothetical protein
MGLFIALGTFYPVQDFIALVHSRSSLLLATKADRVLEIADDAPIPEMELRREIKLNRHAGRTPVSARGSAERLVDHGISIRTDLRMARNGTAAFARAFFPHEL